MSTEMDWRKQQNPFGKLSKILIAFSALKRDSFFVAIFVESCSVLVDVIKQVNLHLVHLDHLACHLACHLGQ